MRDCVTGWSAWEKESRIRQLGRKKKIVSHQPALPLELPRCPYCADRSRLYPRRIHQYGAAVQPIGTRLTSSTATAPAARQFAWASSISCSNYPFRRETGAFLAINKGCRGYFHREQSFLNVRGRWLETQWTTSQFHYSGTKPYLSTRCSQRIVSDLLSRAIPFQFRFRLAVSSMSPCSTAATVLPHGPTTCRNQVNPDNSNWVSRLGTFSARPVNPRIQGVTSTYRCLTTDPSKNT